MPLHDKYVARCYVGDTPSHPVQRSKHRTWVEYWTQVSTAINEDLTARPPDWVQLQEIAGDSVSPLRVLDVVAWNAGKAPAQYE